MHTVFYDDWFSYSSNVKVIISTTLDAAVLGEIYEVCC
jgi:hypothetical protein